VIGNDQQVGGRAKVDALAQKQPWIDVSVRADDGQVGDRGVQLYRYLALRGVGIEITVGGA